MEERADQHLQETTARTHAERMYVLSGQLAVATTVTEVAEAVVREGAHLLDATAGALALTNADGGFDLITEIGDLWQRDPTLGAAASDLLTEIVTGASPCFLDDLVVSAWQHPQPAHLFAKFGAAAAAILPLVVEGRALGMVIFTFDRPQTATAPREIVHLIAGQAAQALERARLQATIVAERVIHEQARGRAAFAADLLGSLDATTGFLDRVNTFLDALVPRAADFASVEIMDEAHALAIVAARHRDHALDAEFGALRREHALDRTIVGSAANVAQTDRPHLVNITRSSLDEYSLAPAARTIIDRLEPRSVMTLPLGPPGRRIGAVLMGTSGSEARTFDADDLAYFSGLTRQVGLSLDNAQLDERHREVSLRLQKSLLGDSVPDVPGVAVAAFYEPATPDLEVGGDWCEAIELPDGRVGLFVGDVVGRGLDAATAMGQLRAAIRALALTSETPGGLLERLALFAETIPAADCATVVAAMFDRHTGEFAYACAAHPPPLVIDPDGTTRFLEDGRSGPLIVTAGSRRIDARVTLAPGARVVLYTDGLVERRGESIDVGLTRLANVAHARRGRPGPEFVSGLVGDLTAGQRRSDDIAVLCIDLAATTASRYFRRFAACPHELAELRTTMRAWFAALRIADRDANDILVAVSEAVANAIEHAYSPGDAGDVEVELLRDGAHVTLRVRDRGSWNLFPAPGDRGRGLPLMRAVSHVDVRRSLSGTTVTMRRILSTAG